MKRVLYYNAVGCLMYLTMCTRPDLVHGANLISRYMSNPGKHHWKAIKWVL